ncbi:HVA22-like protein i [Hibiscus syriacus]|uniref:HVA22-like protein n=1 Tax=Hibiscus syriacus TaxID=106335 RepID=A0A6A3BL69_HIBSY|nr:putative HVA22-like protein g [Hibiscus syriacus]KAE8717055.1 HVA22-like protein i [Hibiscus syriacus]
MLGDFLNGLLVLIFGYAYPAFECFKMVEKKRVEMDELRFWCKYWILVAFITVIERITDIFISWLPLYGEMKLGLFIYLWYPKTKGTNFVYDTFLRPYMAEHETEVDRKIMELRARAWDVFTHYWANCSEMGLAKFFEMFQYIAGQTAKFNQGKPASCKKYEERSFNIPPPPSPNGLRSPMARNRGPSTLSRVNFVDSPRFGQQPDSPSTYEFDNDDDSIPYSPSNSRLQQARSKLRRTKPQDE